MLRRSLPSQLRARGVTAVLGPTNTGKTHLAIERMLGHESGMIGLPLRLLAREVYQKVADKAGEHNVALVTGEEKIKPDRPRYWVSTVEAMPRDLDLAFVAVDEIQLAADLDRGHVFTDRLLNQRGREETLLIGSATMRHLVEALIPGVHVITRPRLSKLTFAGETDPVYGWVVNLYEVERFIAKVKGTPESPGLDQSNLDENPSIGIASLENIASYLWRIFKAEFSGLDELELRRGFTGSTEGCTLTGKTEPLAVDPHRF